MVKGLVGQVQVPPPILTVASVHPDYLAQCLELCSTGASRVPSLERGTVTLFRRTTGGKGGRHYGVMGIWWYTGESTVVRTGLRWPRKWVYRIQFAPLVNFAEPFTEMFTETPPGVNVYRGLKASAKVPGLVYTSLQGTIVRVHNLQTASAYLEAILKEKKDEVEVEATYLEEKVMVSKLLNGLVQKLRNLH